MIIGSSTINKIIYIGSFCSEILADMIEIVEKNTTTPTISSRAAIGINVLVTGPSVLNSLTTDKAGAGAVARAIPPKLKQDIMEYL